ncbi:MAG: N-acetyl-gamma-glutamyl-phosphate reductase [Nitrospinota bacterium]
MLCIAVAGATGYAGGELLRILAAHPEVEVVRLTSETYAGRNLADVLPAFRGVIDAELTALDPESAGDGADLVFTALPHKSAMNAVAKILASGKKVVDFSADFRLKDPAAYEKWYGTRHTETALLQQAVYGLPELHREAIREARLVANPGCYPTGAILALAPLLREGLIESGSLLVDAKSGASGAGRRAELDYSYCEINESVRAYSIGRHRHTPEIEQELSQAAGSTVTLSFTPHLIPMSRGILSTCYGRTKEGVAASDLRAAFEEAYRNEPFVRLLPEGEVPSTGQVWGSNFVDLGFVLEERTGRVIVITALDNLSKGAAGAAVQNMNLMAGFPETMALSPSGIPV